MSFFLVHVHVAEGFLRLLACYGLQYWVGFVCMWVDGWMVLASELCWQARRVDREEGLRDLVRVIRF